MASVISEFAEDLREAGLQLWQTLPLGPTGYGNSPYSPRSVFAGNEMLISPEMLYMAGLIDRHEAEPPDLPSGRVDYSEVIRWKSPLLHKAAERAPSALYHQGSREGPSRPSRKGKRPGLTAMRFSWPSTTYTATRAGTRYGTGR